MHLVARLVNHHHYHSSMVKAQDNVVIALLNLSISAHEVLMCTLGILDTIAFCLLFLVVAQYVVVTLYISVSTLLFPLTLTPLLSPVRTLTTTSAPSTSLMSPIALSLSLFIKFSSAAIVFPLIVLHPPTTRTTRMLMSSTTRALVGNGGELEGEE
ncbi:hypothetical protein BHE74_00011619 [Ensete ventricosum]|nr:hypothetical protein BHE74_00011619 [Ensete ventricosum]